MSNYWTLEIRNWTLDIEVGNKRMLFNQIANLQLGK
jgi:hypothetical protein